MIEKSRRWSDTLWRSGSDGQAPEVERKVLKGHPREKQE